MDLQWDWRASAHERHSRRRALSASSNFVAPGKPVPTPVSFSVRIDRATLCLACLCRSRCFGTGIDDAKVDPRLWHDESLERR